MSGGARYLVSTRRRVAPGATDYDRAWTDLERAVAGAGANAWRFRAAADDAAWLEFVEFRGDADPRERSDVAAALRRLSGIAPGEVEEWIETGTQLEERGRDDVAS